MSVMAWDNSLKSVKLRKNASYDNSDYQDFVNRELDKRRENRLAPRYRTFTDFMLQRIVSN